MGQKVLVTGATGNIGSSLIKFLVRYDEMEVIAGVRDVGDARRKLGDHSMLDYRILDFEDENTFADCFAGIDTVFLLRPPHISNVSKFFDPLVKSIQSAEVKRVVFLSVQGADKSTIIPHNRIEKLVEESGLNYIFVRPGYFMQNLQTTLREDVLKRRKIVLPAGDAKFNWVDVENIAEATAILIKDFAKYQNQALDITGNQNKSFGQAVTILNETIEGSIEYKSINPISFLVNRKKLGYDLAYIFVLIMLHWLPRFESEPEISNVYEKLTGTPPTTLKQFFERERSFFEK